MILDFNELSDFGLTHDQLKKAFKKRRRVKVGNGWYFVQSIDYGHNYTSYKIGVTQLNKGSYGTYNLTKINAIPKVEKGNGITMERSKFLSKFHKAKKTLEKKQIKTVLRKSVDSNLSDGNPRGHRNLIIVMEELSELAKEISKELRDKGDKISITEELADVQLGVWYVQEICDIHTDDLNKAINVKVDRLTDVLNSKGQYK